MKRSNVKRLAAVLLTLVMLLSMTACGAKSEAEAPKAEADAPAATGSYQEQVAQENEAVRQGADIVTLSQIKSTENIDTSRKSTYNTDELHDEITVLAANEITTFTPWQGGRGRSETILTIYEPLYYYNDGFELEPCIAKGMEWVDDEHLVVEIYDYVHDYLGNPLTAEDVVFCFDNNIAQGNRIDYYVGVEALDATHVQFTVDTAIHDDIDALPSLLITLLYTEEAYNTHDFATNPVGTGAYYLESMVQGSSYHFVMNENYWQTDETARCSEAGQNLKGWTSTVIRDSSVAYMSFASRELFNNTVASTNLPDFLTGGKYEGQFAVSYEYMTGRYGMAFNMSGHSPVSEDLNLRLAICYAVNGEDIVYALGENSYYQCHAESGLNTIGYQEIWDTTYKDSYYGIYDVDLAKDYLSKSNYNGEELVLLSLSDLSQQQASQIIAEQLKAIGLNVNYVCIEQAILNTYLCDLDAYDIFFFNWNGEALSQQWQRQMDTGAYISTNTHDGVTYNEFGCADPTLQSYIEDVQLVSKATDELYQQIQQYLQDNAYLYSLFGAITYTAYDPDMAMVVSTNGHKDVMWGACEYYLD